MKSRIISICIACFLALSSSFLHAQDPAMYVYRNNGSVNGFIMNQVDSISHSHIGMDSIEYEVPVVQEIWTKNGVYRIPLSEIDSIGYCTPEPILKQGLFIIDEKNVDFVADVDFDALTISFLGNIPDDKLPTKDQVIFCDLEEDPFPMGFSGRVTNIRTVEGKQIYECVIAGPEEVYDRLLMAGHLDSQGIQYNSARRSPRKRGHSEGSYTIKTTLNNLLTISGKGTVTIDYTLNVNAFNSKPASFWLKKQHDLDLEFKLGVKTSDMEGAIQSEWDENLKVKEYWGPPFTLYTVGGVLDVDLMFGCYFEYGKTFSIEASGIKYKYTDIDEYYWSQDNPLHIERKELVNEGEWNFDPREDDPSDVFKLKAELEGSVSFGFCGELDLAIWKPKWISLGLQFKAGPELKGSVAFDTDLLKFSGDDFDIGLYKLLSEDMKMTFGLKLGLDLIARYNYDEWKILSASTSLFSRTVTLLPKLSKPELPKIYKVAPNNYMLSTYGDWDSNLGWDSEDPLNVRTVAKNITLFPGAVGLAIYGQDGKEISTDFGENWHWLSSSTFSKTIKNLSPQTIKVYPMFKMLGLIPLRAEPSVITIPEPLTLSANSVETKEGDTIKIACNDGWGYYTIESTNDKIASLQIIEEEGVQYVEAIGKRPGTATISVKDLRSGVVQTCELKVRSNVFSLSSYSLTMNPNDVRTVSAFPNKVYELINSNPNAATVKVISDLYNSDRISAVIQVTALAVGNSTITVIDRESEHETSFDVVVTDEYIKPGTLSLEPSTIDFGSIAALTTVTEHFTVSNIGEKSLKFRVFENSKYFDVQDDRDIITLEPGKKKTFPVTFSPMEADKDYEYEITIQTDAENGPQILKLKGHGVEPPHALITPSTLDFGDVYVGVPKIMTFTVKNTGQSELQFTINEPESDVFFISESTIIQYLDPNEEKSFKAYFVPNKADQDFSCQVQINLVADNEKPTITLKGRGKEYDYVPGVCSGFTPEDGAVVDASSGYVTLDVHEFVLPQDGANILAITLSTDPSYLGWASAGHRSQGWNITWNGHKGDKFIGDNWYDLFHVNPGTQYYWQVEYFDWETETFVRCSPILSFTTMP